MTLTIFSVMSTIIWVSIFAFLVGLFTKKMTATLSIYSVYPLIILILLCLIRLFFPFELFYTKVIRFTIILPFLQYQLNYPLINLSRACITINLFDILMVINLIIIVKKSYDKVCQYRQLNSFLVSLPDCNGDKRIHSAFCKIQSFWKVKKKVKIIQHEGIHTPAIIGFSPPIIVLPKLQFTQDELLGILGHEWIHYIYGHIIIKFIADIIQTIFWWNPFLKSLNNKLVAHTLELHADNKIKSILNKRQQYSYLNAIIKIVRNNDINVDETIFNTSLVKKEDGLLHQRFAIFLKKKGISNTKYKDICIILIALILLIFSFSFIIQPYSDPKGSEFSMMTVVDKEDYLVKTNNGYKLYNVHGEFIADIMVIDDSLSHLNIIDNSKK